MNCCHYIAFALHLVNAMLLCNGFSIHMLKIPRHSQPKRTKSNTFAMYQRIVPIVLCITITPLPNCHSSDAYAATTIGATSFPEAKSPFYKLSNSDAFKLLPREPTFTKSQRDLRDLKQFEDERLDQCVEKGIFWEQCFLFGQKDDSNHHHRSSGSDRDDPVVHSFKSTIPTW